MLPRTIPFSTFHWHSSLSICREYSRISGPFPNPPRIAFLESAADNAQAQTWIAKFRQHSIPKELVEFTFSRSSGPGGQNVNKVNTKATLRCPSDSPWIPLWARDGICKSPYYATSTKSILISSTMFRSQSQNVSDCLDKLHDLLLNTASALIRNEPSAEQKKRVELFQRADDIRRRKEKSRRSGIKKSRMSGKRIGCDWD